MMDMEKQFLIGEELWDKIGGAGSLRAIVEIIKGVRKDLISALNKPASTK